MQTRMLTLMLTDIKDFTHRTANVSRDRLDKLLRRHRDLVTPIAEQHGGKVIKGMGDAFLIGFQSPTEAVLAGGEIQATLARFNRQAPPADQIELKIAVNSGEVTEQHNDVFGEPVNIVARIQEVTAAGDVVFTDATYLIMNRREVRSAEVGLFQLKGIPEKIKLHRLTNARQPSTGELREIVVDAGQAKSESSDFWAKAVQARQVGGSVMSLDASSANVAIEAPAKARQVHAPVALASLPARLAALLVDLIILLLITFAWLPLGSLAMGQLAVASAVELPTVAVGIPFDLAATVLLAGGYFVTFWSWRGATPGGQLLRIRVVNVSGERLQWQQAVARFLGLILSATVVLLGFFAAVTSRRRQTWHDKLAETIVVKAGRQ